MFKCWAARVWARIKYKGPRHETSDVRVRPVSGWLFTMWKIFWVFQQKCKCMQECFHQRRILITSLLTSWKLTICLTTATFLSSQSAECDTRVMSYYRRVFSVQSLASTFFFKAANLYNYIFHKGGFGASL